MRGFPKQLVVVSTSTPLTEPSDITTPLLSELDQTHTTMNKEKKIWFTSRNKEKVSKWSLFTLFLGFLMLLKTIMTLIMNYITYTDDCYQWLPITKWKLTQYNFSSMNHIITKSQKTIKSEYITCTVLIGISDCQ